MATWHNLHLLTDLEETALWDFKVGVAIVATKTVFEQMEEIKEIATPMVVAPTSTRTPVVVEVAAVANLEILLILLLLLLASNPSLT